MAVNLELAKAIFGSHYIHSTILEAASTMVERGEREVKLSWGLRQRVIDMLNQSDFRLVGVTCNDCQFFIYYFDPSDSIVDAVTFNYSGDVHGCILREVSTIAFARKNHMSFTIN